jgi:hypothetical protein
MCTLLSPAAQTNEHSLGSREQETLTSHTVHQPEVQVGSAGSPGSHSQFTVFKARCRLCCAFYRGFWKRIASCSFRWLSDFSSLQWLDWDPIICWLCPGHSHFQRLAHLGWPANPCTSNGSPLSSLCFISLPLFLFLCFLRAPVITLSPSTYPG